MGSDWKYHQLSDLVQITSGKRPEVVSKTCTAECKVPIYGGGGPSGFTSDSMYSAGVVVTGRVGTLGKLFAPHEDFWPTDNTLVIIPQSPDADPSFLRYSLELAIPQLTTANRGAANPLITQGDVARLIVRIPPLPEQRAIAHILSTLDDKIELNRQMNKTLEEMARAIFKSWFVDFDPVRARAEGRDTGLPDEIAALFPDSFQDSEIGEIPRGWEVNSLGGIADYLNGLACQKYPPEDDKESLPVIKIRELQQGITDNTDRASANVPADYVVRDGDVLFSWSGSLLIDIWTQGRAVLNQHLFKVSSLYYPKWFYFYWIEQHLDEFKRIAAYKATTMGHIKRHHLADAKVCVPNDEVMHLADEQINPLFELRIQNELEAKKLASIRDTLLPKLISGELRVPDAEYFVARSI